MPNIAAVLKGEITRLARKEVRIQTGSTKKASAQYRRDIATLKREVAKLTKQVALLEAQVLKNAPTLPSGKQRTAVRFTAKGLRSQRKRLGLSIPAYAKLAGVSPQSIYNWEHGVARPRKEHVVTLAALRGMSKVEAGARLRQLGK